MQSGDAKDMRRLRPYFFKTKGSAVRLGCFGAIDTEVNKGGGDVGDCGNVEANGAAVGGEKVANGRADLRHPHCIHPAVEEDPEGSLFGLVGETGSVTSIHQVVHACQGKNTADFGRAVGDPKDAVAALEFPRGLEDQAQDSGSDISDILKIAAEVRGLPIQFGPKREFELLAGDGVEPSGKDEGDSRPIVVGGHKAHGRMMSASDGRSNPVFLGKGLGCGGVIPARRRSAFYSFLEGDG